MPIRSSGCATCRKRKIRCDEGRPGCRRCATHGVPCPGYRTDKPGGIEFKDQTKITVKKANEQYKTKTSTFTASWKNDRVTASPSRSSSDSSDGASSTSSSTGTGLTTPGSAVASTRISRVDEGLTEKQSLVLTKSTPPQKGCKVISPIPLLSPTMERARLYNEFVTTYLPITRGGAQNGHFSFFQTIVLKQSDEPALQHGLDALSLVQVGSLYKNQPLLKQAVLQYGKALSSLHRSISKGSFLYDDDVLAAVSVMATCELYGEIQNMGEGWGKHVAGANQLVAARGPDSIRSDLALLLYSNMRHGSLLHALIHRKAPFMATPEWRRVAFRVPKSALDSSTLFYDTAIQIPGLLERHDALDLDLPTALEDIDKLLFDSSRLETEMRNWFIEWQAQSVLDHRILCEHKPIEEFTVFLSLCQDRTFDHAYWFPDFLIAYLHSLYWLVMHYLRTNTQALHKHRHELLHDWYPSEDIVVRENELLGYVLNLCKCIPFFGEPISSSTGSVGIFLPMRCAAMYFTQHGHWQWLKWVGNVRSSVFVKGLAPPNVNHNRGKVSPGP